MRLDQKAFCSSVASETALLWHLHDKRLCSDTHDSAPFIEILNTHALLQVIAALIHSDGRLEMLAGDAPADPACIAALGHAVQVAGVELMLRLRGTEAHGVRLQGATSSITLVPGHNGALLLVEHDTATSAAEVQALAGEMLAARQKGAPREASGVSRPPSIHHQTALARPPRSRGVVSLSDALNATEP